MKLWSWFLDTNLPQGPTKLSPEDRFNIGLLYDDDTYKSLRKLLRNYEYIIMTKGMTARGPEADHNLGQLFAIRQIEKTIKKINKEYRKKSMVQ